MKICHISSVHQWNDVRIFEKECSSMVDKGHEVHLIMANGTPGEYNGVHLHKVEPKGKSRVERMLKTAKAIAKKAVELQPDIIHFHDPEFLVFAKRMAKVAHVVFDSHEDVPRQILDKHYLPEFSRTRLSKTVEKLEKKACRKHLSAVVAATPHIAKRFASYGIEVANVNNYPRLASFVQPGSWEDREDSAVYIGGVFRTRGAVEMVQAAGLADIPLEIAGNYSPLNLRDNLVQVAGWNNVHEHGFVGRKKVVELLQKAKYGLVLLHPTESYLKSLPIKMFEYMAAGLPVVASDFPLWREIIEKHGCGVCVDPNDPEAIAEALKKLKANDQLAKEMGERGRAAVESFFTWENEAEKLDALYQRIMARNAEG